MFTLFSDIKTLDNERRDYSIAKFIKPNLLSACITFNSLLLVVKGSWSLKVITKKTN